MDAMTKAYRYTDGKRALRVMEQNRTLELERHAKTLKRFAVAAIIVGLIILSL